MKKNYCGIKIEVRKFHFDVITMSINNLTDNFDGDIF